MNTVHDIENVKADLIVQLTEERGFLKEKAFDIVVEHAHIIENELLKNTSVTLDNLIETILAAERRLIGSDIPDSYFDPNFEPENEDDDDEIEEYDNDDDNYSELDDDDDEYDETDEYDEGDEDEEYDENDEDTEN